MGNVRKGIISNLNESYIVSLEEAENNFIIALSKESVQVIANNIENEDDLYEAYIKEIFTNKEDLEDESKIGYSTTVNKDEAQKFSKEQAEEYAAIAQRVAPNATVLSCRMGQSNGVNVGPGLVATFFFGDNPVSKDCEEERRLLTGILAKK